MFLFLLMCARAPAYSTQCARCAREQRVILSARHRRLAILAVRPPEIILRLVLFVHRMISDDSVSFPLFASHRNHPEQFKRRFSVSHIFFVFHRRRRRCCRRCRLYVLLWFCSFNHIQLTYYIQTSPNKYEWNGNNSACEANHCVRLMLSAQNELRHPANALVHSYCLHPSDERAHCTGDHMAAAWRAQHSTLHS